MPTGVFPNLKLGGPLQMPKKRLALLLAQSRHDCNVVRNAVATAWYVWRRENPQWTPGEKDSKLCPRNMLNRELYHIGCNAAPNLSTKIVSRCVRDVVSKLKANVPYNHDGDARWFWQAVLSNEVSLPTWRKGRIPVPLQDMVIGYDGIVLPGAKKPNRSMVTRAAESGCAIRFALLSRASGYSVMSPIVRLKVKDFTVGQRRLLRRMVADEVHIGDSQIIEKDGEWFVQLVYDVPVKASGFSEDKVLTVLPAQPEDKWPFELRWGDESRWYIGNGRGYGTEYQRIQARRRAIRHRYKSDSGKGHGKQRAYKSLQPMTRAVQDLAGRFQKQTISDVVKLALREQCGTLVYREPSKPIRNRAWFSKKHDAPFDWTEFEARLRFKCEQHGIKYVKERILWKEWRRDDGEEAVA